MEITRPFEEIKDDSCGISPESLKAILEGRYPCPTLLDLRDFAAGRELDFECPFSRAAIEEHLQHCAECQKIYPDIQAIAKDSY